MNLRVKSEEHAAQMDSEPQSSQFQSVKGILETAFLEVGSNGEKGGTGYMVGGSSSRLGDSQGESIVS